MIWLRLISPRMWLNFAILLVIAGAAYYVYDWAFDRGAESIQVKWDAAENKRKDEALIASEAARAKEQELIAKNQKVSADYAKQKKTNDVLAASLNDSLRQLQDTINNPASSEASRPAGVNGAGGLERELFGSCSKALSELAITADRLEGKVVGLQGYVRDVCVIP